MEKKIQKVTVVGTGTLGTQIAVLAACFDYKVSVYDTDEGSFIRGLQNLKTVIETAGKKSAFPTDDVDTVAKTVTFCKDLGEAVQDADLVIEAVFEDLELKRKTFEKLDALAPRKAILATNSSSMPVSKIESATTRPEQCVNTHFYYPARGQSMVDVMGGNKDNT